LKRKEEYFTLPVAGQRNSYFFHTAIMKICSTCDSKILNKKRSFLFKRYPELEIGYKVINKEAAELIKTRINDRFDSGIIEMQNLLKTRNHPDKRVIIS